MSTTSLPKTEIVAIDICRDGRSKQLQLTIGAYDENGRGHGYRLAGPKFNGGGETLLKVTLDAHDAAEIRTYLNRVFPEVVVIDDERMADRDLTTIELVERGDLS